MSNDGLNIVKYENAVLYFLHYCNNKYLGMTKLYKLLYYLDFISFRDHGKSVTGDIYRRLPYGPVGIQVEAILEELGRKNSIDSSKISSEYDKVIFNVKDGVDLMVFTEKERMLLKNISNHFLHYTTAKIVNQSHAEAPWLYTDPFQKIDYKFSADIDII